VKIAYDESVPCIRATCEEESYSFRAGDEVSHFLLKWQSQLGKVVGFHVHLTSFQERWEYQVQKNGDLLLRTEDDDVISFRDWVYVPGHGFFKHHNLQLRATRVRRREVSNYIDKHLNDLEKVSHFFAPSSPIVKMLPSLTLDKERMILVYSQSCLLVEGTEEGEVIFYDRHVFHERHGFSPLLSFLRKDKVIHVNQWKHFIEVECPCASDLNPQVRFVQPVCKISQIKREEQPPPGKRQQNTRRNSKGEQCLDSTVDASGGAFTWYIQMLLTVEGDPIDPAILLTPHEVLICSHGLIDANHPQLRWRKWLQGSPVIIESEPSETLSLSNLSFLEMLRLCASCDGGAQHVEAFLSHADAPLCLKGFKGQLRTYQKEGAQWLWSLYQKGVGGLLCDEMGLGKTHQVLALIHSILRAGSALSTCKVLIICPTAVLSHWERLLGQVLPQVSTTCYHGTDRTIQNDPSPSIILSSYGVLLRDAEQIKKHTFSLVVMDEVHLARNQRSKTFEALRSLQALVRVGLTGTPVSNSIGELKGVMNLVLPSYIPDSLPDTLIEQWAKPFILRRKKKDVLKQLPPKIEQTVECLMTEEQEALYHKLVQEIHHDLEGKAAPHLMHLFSLFTKLKMVCDHPALHHKNISSYSTHKSGKWELFCTLLQEALASGQKVVVFSQYVSMLEIMKIYLEEHGISYVCVTGSTKNRSQFIERFQKDDIRVFLGSLRAVGVGIDLSAASCVIHYDRWWNPSWEDQATDRLHRIGQKRGVLVINMLTLHSLEEKIAHMIDRKKSLQGVGEGAEMKLSKQEWLQVLRSLQ